MFQKLSVSASVLLSVGVATRPAPQWVPVTARIRQTTEDIKDGKVVERDVKEGFYYRSQDGSTLTKWVSLNGEEQSVGDLFDNTTARSYKLYYSKGNATPDDHGTIKFQPLSPGIYKPQEQYAIGHDSVSGISCY